MPIPFLSDADFRGHQTIRRVIELQPSAPAAVSVGQEVYDTTAKAPLYFDGGAWRNPFARGDHTGTQSASTINDWGIAVLQALNTARRQADIKLTEAHVAAGGPGYAFIHVQQTPFAEAAMVTVDVDGRAMPEGSGWRISADRTGIDVWIPTDADLLARYLATVTYSVSYFAP